MATLPPPQRKHPPLFLILLSLIILASLTACGWRAKEATVSLGEKPIRVIAVLPVVNQAKSDLISGMLRNRVIDSLYFKGYPRLASAAVDRVTMKTRVDTLSREDIARISTELGADALLKITLTKAQTSDRFFYSSVELAASFTIVSPGAPGVLWETKREESSSVLTLTREGKARALSLHLEPLLEKMIQNALILLPEGPLLVLEKKTKEQ